jgi:hypothetical protein
MTEIDHEEYFDPFAVPGEDNTQYDLELLGQGGAKVFYEAIQNASNGTARSKQAQDYRLGVSNLGHCRQYAKYMIEQVPFSDVRDTTPAFFGTVAGEAIEAQIKLDHPDWLTQEKCVVRLPNDAEIPGTADVVIPASAGCTYDEFVASMQDDYDGPLIAMQGVWDGKSKAELETIKKYGPNQQQIFQIHAYTKAMIDKGLLDPTQPIVIMDVFFDRSGRNVIPYGVAHIYREEVIDQINEWVNDVIYAVINKEDASRDPSRDFCFKYCEYATHCRGLDTDVQGLIEDPEQVQLIETYKDLSAIKSEAEKKMKTLAPMITVESGSTGKWNVRRTWINEGEVHYTRPGYFKLDIRAVPKSKGK